jgi:hypothetical protein
MLMSLLLAIGRLYSGELFKDDFSHYPSGWLSSPINQLNGAIQQYHYFPHRGVPLEPWANPIVHLDAWVVSDEDGKPYLEQHLVNLNWQLMNTTFTVGDAEWFDYTVEVKVKPLSLAQMAGVVFRYHTNRHYYLFALTGCNKARLISALPIEKALRVAEWRELASTDFTYDVKRYYLLRVENDGPRIRAYVDGKLVLEASDTEIPKGKAGLSANIPARFQDFRVRATDATEREIKRRVVQREAELEKLRQENPKPKLWKQFATPGFGAGRNVRFGDLDGDGKLDMLIAQVIHRVRDDAYDQISSLTALTLDGKVLWQQGKPDPRNGLFTNCGSPFQIYDIDGDGRQEVVLVRDFKLQILDGSTGKLKKWTWMPPAESGGSVAGDSKDRPYELSSGDQLAFLNLSGQGPGEILVKDLYHNFWIFDKDLKLLWKGQGQLGHFLSPNAVDVNADGRKEFVIGYSLWNADGHRIWSHDAELQDHADGIAMGNFSDDPKAPMRVAAAGSDEGFLLFDARTGNILKHNRIGHAQSLSIGKYRMDVPGLQLLTLNFWNNSGILSMFDYQGTLLGQEELTHATSPLPPVNWRGDGQEFAMLSGNVREGGLMDGQFRRVVTFPDDGHPDLTYYVADVTGDARDEIILWDQERVWIYTQDQPFTGTRIYKPFRTPPYNDSQCLAGVSIPAWK